ncbi:MULTISPECIES: 4-hydroxyphenylpyruvate dioxygenase [unclassified Bacillus (in: firmicutes)]|uniref:4-hydroxyphenylpyruvate dioxygenase n=1 Tax=unclassified Bacillus (in: firmicutes) TaxID=185979 RepID=UPI0008EB1059|nr:MULTISPECIES: 4-hydroxyphenylpyruvate dioxygenase [unclassified Bacillus (in: firmicutes)]SFA88578.1 4-hydroxyphenylpyruvate dioxygenase [Bacillus sp. UNCCL13]SFQ84646.1 4-hydroxyphenylpyruvate dioxygenase [Bacillus sp. cl95]
MQEKALESNKTVEEIFPVQEVDYLEIYTGNAKQACHFFCTSFGFKPVAYSGLETGNRETVSYVLQQRKIRLVITGSLVEDSRVSTFVKKHGDGVKDIALTVKDVEKAYNGAVERGAIAIMPPIELKDEHGTVKKAVIGTYGDTIHTLIERKDYKGIFIPGFQKHEMSLPVEDAGFIAVDHVVGNVERMEEWVNYYANVMGFTEMKHFTDKDITTEYSALMSKVMHNGGRIKFPINEPALGKRKSQIQEYLEFYNGPGVQHLAILTEDIISTVTTLRKNGVEFLSTPSSYYEALSERVGKIDEEIAKLQELNILVDRDDEGYLLQIFTKPIVDRPTLFIEVIQRKGARGFGEGNFKALFESIEREQERRGNL